MASLLHPEARSPDLNAKYCGTLRVPMVKVIHSVNAVEKRDAHEILSCSDNFRMSFTISTTEKWLRKLYVYSNNINMSDEDNNHDTNYINKFHDANHDARKLHE